jgi:general secretion pathway protein F
MASVYRLITQDPAGRMASLSMLAASPEEARAQASARGLKVVEVQGAAVAAPAWQRGPRFDLMLFAQELAALLEAGLALTEAIEALAEKELRPQMKVELDALRDALYQGNSLSQAMAARGSTFPDLLIASIRASEVSGDLDRALGRYISYQEQIDALRKRLISAATYPAMLLFAGGGVCAFLLGYLVPKFSRIYEGMHGDLPFASRLLLSFGGVVEQHRGLAVASIVAIIVGLTLLLRMPATRAQLGLWAWRSPGLGTKLKLFQLARFYRAAGMLLCSGIPLVASFERVADLLHPSLRGALMQAVGQLKQGQALADTMAAAGLTTPVALRLIRVGERSGKLGEMMERAAAFHDDELARFVDMSTKLIEPMLMMFMGGFIGLIVVLMYLPIFDLAGGMQ